MQTRAPISITCIHFGLVLTSLYSSISCEYFMGRSSVRALAQVTGAKWSVQRAVSTRALRLQPPFPTVESQLKPKIPGRCCTMAGCVGVRVGRCAAGFASASTALTRHCHGQLVRLGQYTSDFVVLAPWPCWQGSARPGRAGDCKLWRPGL